jgi:hypothetical protein
LANIRAMLYDIPLGYRRVEIGLNLRQAWFLNGLLFNSEVWQPISKSDMNELEVLDHRILASILGTHPKAAIE